MSEEAGKRKDQIGLIVKIAGAVTAIAGAGAAVAALIPESEPPPPPPPPPSVVSGSLRVTDMVHRVRLTEYQRDDMPKVPSRCAHFTSPQAPSTRVARAPRGGGVPLATIRIASAAMSLAQINEKDTTTGTTTVPGDPGQFADTTTTTTKGTTTTDTTTTTTPGAAATTTTTPTTQTLPTTTTTTTTTERPSAREPKTGVLTKGRASATFTMGGDEVAASGKKPPPPDALADVLDTTRTAQPEITKKAIERLKSGDVSSPAARKEIAAAYEVALGTAVEFDVRLVGLAGRCSYVRWSLYDAKTHRRADLPGRTDRDAMYLRPEGNDETQVGTVWVGTPPAKRPYFVLLELFKDEGSQLGRRKTPTFT